METRRVNNSQSPARPQADLTFKLRLVTPRSQTSKGNGPVTFADSRLHPMKTAPEFRGDLDCG
jgi:hypothetical protein